MYTLKNKYIDNKKISIIEIKQNNIEVSFMDYGAMILSILVPDKNKKFENVLMGFEDLESYVNNSIYLN